MKQNTLTSWSIIAAGVAILSMMPATASAQTLLNRWSFDNGGVATTPGSGGTVVDSVGGQIGTLEGDAYFDGTNVVLDGTYGTDVELVGGLLTNLTAVSLEGWVNCTVSGGSAHLWEFGDGNGTGNEYARYVIYQNGNSSSQMELADFGGTTGDPNQELVAATGFGGVPVHVICTYDQVAGVQLIYTNGVLEASRSFPSDQTTLSSVSTDEAALGKSPWYAYGDAFTAGTIPEFRIWNAALNPLQVAALDAAGPKTVSTNYGTVTGVQLNVSYQMSVHQIQQAVVLATASGLSVQPNIAPLATYVSGNTSILTVSSTGAIDALASGPATITAIYGTVSNTQTITVSQPAAVLSNRWSFYAPSATAGSPTVTDSVNGVVATLEGDAILDGTNVNLDGTAGTYVELSSNLISGIASLTCEGWISTNSISPDNVHLFEFSDGVGKGNAYYRYNLHESGNANNFSEIADVSTGGSSKLQSTPGLGGYGMLHIVTIYDPVAQVEAIFTNGSLEVAESGVTTSLSGVATNEAALGQSPWFAYGDPYLNGSIKEFRIYSGELTPQQIAINYLAGPGALNTNGPGALQSIALQMEPPMNLGVSATPRLLVTYAKLTNFDLTENSIFPVAGLTVISSATNIISVNANNVLTAVTNGTATITATYQGFTSQATVTVVLPPFKYNWSAPVAFNSLNADQILTNVPGVILGAAVFGGTPQTVTLSDGQVISFTADGSVAAASGNGTFAGAYPAGTANTTGNADFDAVLNEGSWDGGPKTISINNLTVGQYYSVQLFGLDDRSGGETSRLANYQDPNYVLDVSGTFHMGDNVYVVGAFWASNTTENVKMNLPTGNAGNINALVVRQVPTVAIQAAGVSIQLTWPAGTLLQAPTLAGPWTTNANTSPYTFAPTEPHMFYRVQLP